MTTPFPYPTLFQSTHAKLEAIDKALVASESLRNIAERFGTSTTALHRHKTDHLPSHMAKAQEVKDNARALDLWAELERISRRVNLLFDACEIGRAHV